MLASGGEERRAPLRAPPSPPRSLRLTPAQGGMAAHTSAAMSGGGGRFLAMPAGAGAGDGAGGEEEIHLETVALRPTVL